MVAHDRTRLMADSFLPRWRATFQRGRSDRGLEGTELRKEKEKRKKEIVGARTDEIIALAIERLRKPYKRLIPNGVSPRGPARISKCDLSHCWREFFLT